MTRPGWLPEAYRQGLQDFIDEAKPQLTEKDFASRLAGYLKQHENDPGLAYLKGKPQLPLDLVKRLFKRCLYFLKEEDGFKRMRPIVKNPEWTKHLRAVTNINQKRPLTKQLNAFERELAQLEVPKLGSSPRLFQELRRCLRLLKRYVERFEAEAKLLQDLMQADKKLLGGWSKPEPESQLMLDLDNCLRNGMPTASDETRRLIVTACAVAAKVVPRSIEDRVVYDRIRRARTSYFRR